MKRESKTQYALLGILSQCEMNGYEIRKYIESTISFSGVKVLDKSIQH